MNYLITGSSSKVGINLIQTLLQDNHKIFAIYNTENKNLKKLLKIKKNNLYLYKVDLSKENQINNFFNKLKKNKIVIDSFISFAAIRENISFEKLTKKDLLRNFEINTISNFLIIKYISKDMLKKKYGRILICSSIGVKFGGSNETFGYSISKHASEFIPKITKEWALKNVLYNVLRLGVLDSKYTDKMKTKDLKNRKKLIPVGRIANTIEISNYIVWLTSEKNTFVTRELLSISGGE
tara:strand:+ start:1624 stop:2337 length:714 start_codon:yes stop_codon:yes gene_type:complete